jgi:hypothetical protein
VQLIYETQKLGPITISKYVIQHFNDVCDGDLEKAFNIALDILKSSEIERLEIPFLVARTMTSNGDDPNALEFWVHKDTSTMFLINPENNFKKVSMATKQDMTGIQFVNSNDTIGSDIK